MEYFEFDTSKFIYDILIPCLLACIFGGIIGFQRERHDRPAGLRTHTLVCLGATSFTIVSCLGFSSQTGFDPSRIAAGVVTGIGFIGAGAIFKQGSLVKGITTAASIWVAASIGLALGTKMYYLAVVITILGFLALSTVKYIEKKFVRVPNYTLNITTPKNFTSYKEIKDFLEKVSTNVRYRKYNLDDEKNKMILTVNVQSRDPEFSIKLLQQLSKLKEIEKVTIS